MWFIYFLLYHINKWQTTLYKIFNSNKSILFNVYKNPDCSATVCRPSFKTFYCYESGDMLAWKHSVMLCFVEHQKFRDLLYLLKLPLQGTFFSYGSSILFCFADYYMFILFLQLTLSIYFYFSAVYRIQEDILWWLF